MKKLITTVSAMLAALVFAAQVNAAAITFDPISETSSVSISGLNIAIGDWSYDVSHLDSLIFDVAVGDSHTFDFFNINLPNLGGLGLAQVDATLGFAQPWETTGSGQGSGWWIHIGGWFDYSNGALNWSDFTNPITSADGTSFNLVFNDLSGDDFNNGSATVTATVTAVAAAVPEPGTLALLGLGLVALGASRRRS